MRVKRRILVSAPRDIRLDAARIGIKRAIIDRIEQFGDQLQVWLKDPGQINYWLIAVVLLMLGTATWYVRRWLIASSEASRSGVNDARTV